MAKSARRLELERRKKAEQLAKLKEVQARDNPAFQKKAIELEFQGATKDPVTGIEQSDITTRSRKVREDEAVVLPTPAVKQPATFDPETGDIIGGGFQDLSPEDQIAFKQFNARIKTLQAEEEQKMFEEQEAERKKMEANRDLDTRVKEAEMTAKRTKEEFSRAEDASKGVVDRSRGETEPNAIDRANVRGLRTARESQKIQLNTLFDNLESARLDMQASEKSQDLTKRVDARLKEERALEALYELEQEIEAGADKDLEKSLEYIDNLSNESLIGLSDDDISRIDEQFAEAGRPMGIITALKAKAQQIEDAKNNLLKDPENVELQNKLKVLTGQVDKIKASAATDTKTEQEIAGFQRLLDQGIINKEEFDQAVEGQIGVISAYEQSMNAVKLQNERLKGTGLYNDALKQQADLDQLGQVFGTGDENVLNKLTNYTVGQKPITRKVQIDGEDRNGWCGAFVNDNLGIPGFFGDTYLSKIGKKNKDITQIPSAGDVFISNVGNVENGHVGFIKSVQFNEQGETTATIADSNRNGKTLYGERTVTLSALLAPESQGGEEVQGYYSPVNASRTGINDGTETKAVMARLSRANAGESTQTVKSNTAAIQNALKSGDEETVNLAIDEIERKKFLPRTEKIQNDFEKGVADFEDIEDKYNQMTVALKAGRDIDDFTFTDQAIISLFNKISDPASVVRESEFNRTGQSLGLSDRIVGATVKQIKGGGGLTDKTRQAAVNIAEALRAGAEKRFDKEKLKAEKKAETSGIPIEFLYSQLGLNKEGVFGGEEEIIEDVTPQQRMKRFRLEKKRQTEVDEINSLIQ